MRLHNADDEFLDLALSSLDSLSIKPHDATHPYIAALARLPSLTRLELIECFGGYSVYTPLHSLGLVELALISRADSMEAIFVPGALTRLQRLHLEEGGNWRFIGNCQGKHQLETQDKVRDVILGLPNLQKITGVSSIFPATEDN